MPPINRRNPARPDLLLPDQLGQGYQHWQEPIGDFGIFNGQFELGPGSGSPPGWPEGWEIYPHAGGSVTRVTGGFAGDWCLYAGQAGTGKGGWVQTLRYFPVNEIESYYLAGTFKGSDVNAQITLGVIAYTAAHVAQWATPVLTISPGMSWVTYERHLGPLPNSDNDPNIVGPLTRYVRVYMDLQDDVTLTNSWIYADNIQFQQAKATQSAKMWLEQDFATDAQQDFTDDVAYTVWANSTLTLTLTEPGYIWYEFFWSTQNRTAIRSSSARWRAYIDGGPDSLVMFCCSPGINYLIPMAMPARSSTVLAPGVHTVDLRCQVVNAGDTQRGNNMQGAAWYAREL